MASGIRIYLKFPTKTTLRLNRRTFPLACNCNCITRFPNWLDNLISCGWGIWLVISFRLYRWWPEHEINEKYILPVAHGTVVFHNIYKWQLFLASKLIGFDHQSEFTPFWLGWISLNLDLINHVGPGELRGGWLAGNVWLLRISFTV